ncbi:helix-turn-helix domain-containing protein [Mycobacteroides abscessus]|uniref:helix-turn-helix domain-containing protein n=1 Tax=Mycobacteroides abscessus TaxID=36809 RepID=UPI00210417A7|nr:helix-turn-helix domain-containing protein [Mycobacteroides abscessus]
MTGCVHLRDAVSNPDTPFARLVERIGPDQLAELVATDHPEEPGQRTNHVLYRPNRQLIATQRTELVQLRREGWTVKAIAEHLGAHRATITRHLANTDVPAAKSKPGIITASVLTEMVRRYEAGESTYELADAYGFASSSVQRALKRQGVSMRPARKFNRGSLP